MYCIRDYFSTYKCTVTVQEPTVKDLKQRDDKDLNKKHKIKNHANQGEPKWNNIYSFESILFANGHCNRCRWRPRIPVHSSCCPLVREESAGSTAWRQWSRSPADLRTKPAGNSTALFPLHTTSWIFYAMLTDCLSPSCFATEDKELLRDILLQIFHQTVSEEAKCVLKCDHLPGSCIILCPHV